MNRNKWFTHTLLAVLLIPAILEGLFYLYGAETTPITASLADILFLILLVLLVDNDSKNYPQITRPFDYGFFLYIFWLPYLPYYLWRTRGPLGLLMFAGFIILLFLGWLIQLGIYMANAAVAGS